MSEVYKLRDMDNRDDSGAPFEFEAATLREMIPYVDGPLREDVTGEDGLVAVDEVVEALQRGEFPVAQARLRELSVYISLEVDDEA